jgi:predicted GH43/DUF377 family glycosyl hydrolase
MKYQMILEDYIMHFNEHVLMTSIHEHEIAYIGGGCPPCETKEGWLIYHGVHDSVDGYGTQLALLY